jgi:transposase
MHRLGYVRFPPCSVHLADTGFIDAELIVESNQRYHLDLLGPARPDNHRQAREGRGFAAQDFVINWESQQATCPARCISLSWSPAIDKQKNAVVKIKFSMRDCQPCVNRHACTSAKRRTVTLRPQAQHEALQATRIRQTTPEFKQAYGQRAGIEGTLSQGVRMCDLRRSRYIGQAKTHLQHLATASAINLMRVAEWLHETPRAKTRCSPFERLFRTTPHLGASP